MTLKCPVSSPGQKRVLRQILHYSSRFQTASDSRCATSFRSKDRCSRMPRVQDYFALKGSEVEFVDLLSRVRSLVGDE